MKKTAALFIAAILLLSGIHIPAIAADNYSIDTNGVITYSVNKNSVTGVFDSNYSTDGQIVHYQWSDKGQYFECNLDNDALNAALPQSAAIYKVRVTQRISGSTAGNLKYNIYADDILYSAADTAVSGTNQAVDAGFVMLSSATGKITFKAAETPSKTAVYVYQIQFIPVTDEDVVLNVNKNNSGEEFDQTYSTDGCIVTRANGQYFTYNTGGLSGGYDVYLCVKFSGLKTGAYSIDLYNDGAFRKNTSGTLNSYSTDREYIYAGSVICSGESTQLKFEFIKAPEAAYVYSIKLCKTAYFELPVNRQTVLTEESAISVENSTDGAAVIFGGKSNMDYLTVSAGQQIPVGNYNVSAYVRTKNNGLTYKLSVDAADFCMGEIKNTGGNYEEVALGKITVNSSGKNKMKLLLNDNSYSPIWVVKFIFSPVEGGSYIIPLNKETAAIDFEHSMLAKQSWISNTYSTGKYAGLHEGAYITFAADIINGGEYDLYIKAGSTRPHSYSVAFGMSADEAASAKTLYSPQFEGGSGYYDDLANELIGTLELPTGKNYIKICVNSIERGNSEEVFELVNIYAAILCPRGASPNGEENIFRLNSDTVLKESTAASTNRYVEIKSGEHVTWKYYSDAELDTHLVIETAAEDRTNLLLKVNGKETEITNENAVTHALNSFTPMYAGNVSVLKGENTFLLKNTGDASIRVKEYSFFNTEDISDDTYCMDITAQNAVEYAGVTFNDTAVFIEDAFYETDVFTKHGGEYCMTLEAMSGEEFSFYIYNNGVWQSNPKAFSSCSDFTSLNMGTIRLQPGKNTIRIVSDIAESIAVASMTLTYLDKQAEKEKEAEILQAANSLKKPAEAESFFEKYGVFMETDIQSLMYKKPILERIAEKSYESYTVMTTELKEHIKAELENPALSFYRGGEKLTALDNGAVNAKINSDKLPQNSEAVLAIYDGNKMLCAKVVPKDAEEYINLDLGELNFSENKNYKLIVLDDFQTLLPLNLRSSYDIYVNSKAEANGTDIFNGIGDALERVKELAPKMTYDIVINLEDEEYVLTEPLTINGDLSGRNGYNIIFRGNGETVFSGAEERVVQQNANIAFVQLDSTELPHLYEISNTITKRAQSQQATVTQITENGFISSDFEEIPDDITDIFVIVDYKFRHYRLKPTSVVKESSGVRFTFNETTWAMMDVFETGTKFTVENAPEFIDENGEYSFSASDKRLYFKSDSAPTQVSVALQDSLLRITDAKSVSFENITFADTNAGGLYTNDILMRQSTMSFDRGTVEAAVSVESSSDITFDSCRFENIGLNAIELNKNVCNTEIINCEFENISAAAIEVNGDADRENITKNILIKNNLIKNTAAQIHSAAAIAAYYTSDTKIVHNHIDGCSYSGISLGWGLSSYAVFECTDNEVSYNKIENVMQHLDDGGHIYTSGPMKNTEIKYNYLLGNTSNGALYPDVGTRFTAWYENVMVLSGDDTKWLTMGTDIYNNRIYNNYSTHPLYTNGWGSVISVPEDAIIFSADNIPQRVAEIIETAGLIRKE